VPGACDEIQRVCRRHRRDFKVRFALQRAGLRDEEVQFAAAQLARQLVPVARKDLYDDARVLLEEFRGGSRQHCFRGVGAAADSYSSGPQVAVADSLAVEFIGHAQQVPGLLDVQAPEVTGYGAAARSQEQLAAEPRLELLDAARQRGLAHVQRGCRADETPMLRERDDLPQLLQFESHASTIY